MYEQIYRNMYDDVKKNVLICSKIFTNIYVFETSCLNFKNDVLQSTTIFEIPNTWAKKETTNENKNTISLVYIS